MVLIDQEVKIPVEISVPIPQVIQPSYKLQVDNFFVYLENLTPDNIFMYCTIIFVTVAIFSQFDIGLNTVVGLLVACVGIVTLMVRQNSLREGNNLHSELKLNSLIPVPDFFYMDVNIVDTMFNLLEYHSYAPEDYSSVIEHIDNVLGLELDTEKASMVNCQETVDVMRNESAAAIEALKRIQIAIPYDEILEKKLLKGIPIIELYLNRHISIAVTNCNEPVSTYRGVGIPSSVTRIPTNSDLEMFDTVDPDEIPYNKELQTPYLPNRYTNVTAKNTVCST
jgi:hypothetical protein